MECEAQYDFIGASKEDLKFKKNDILVVIKTTEDPNWWLASDKTGKQGMIPANYVELIVNGAKAALPRDKEGNLVPMPWFHGKITRELAEELLTPKEEGLFLVRESAHFPGDYTLCVCGLDDKGKLAIDHYRMQGKNGKLTIDDEVFLVPWKKLCCTTKRIPTGCVQS